MKEQPLENHLQTYYRFSSFRVGQKEIIEDILRGKDVLGVLPTGSGKSLCYQLPARILPGTTIVISPLISLMIDQVKQLKANGFKDVIALNSFMDPKEKRMVYQNLDKYKLIYISPELIQYQVLLFHLQRISISIFVIDEAHCISQWGHEFRPDYLKLNSIIHSLGNPPVLALSATATRNVQEDIIKALKKPKIIKHLYPIDKENICFSIQKVDNDQEKIQSIFELLTEYRVPTIIYFSSRIATESVAQILTNKLSHQRIAFYHGGMDQMDRITIQQQFMDNQIDVICCTSAFGMGINKNNVRLVIHYHFPPQLESYIQEVGRAGRDGNSSISVLFHSKRDELLPELMIENELPTEENLKYIFIQFHQLAMQKQSLPTSILEIEAMFKINEIQWRFIHYQAEKNGIIVDNEIVYDQVHWENAFHSINHHRKQRFLVKQSKLKEMIQWMNEKDCLRKHLYKRFQSSYQKPNNYCCSNCGFSLFTWKPFMQSERREKQATNWESKLQSLLLVGVSDETK